VAKSKTHVPVEGITRSILILRGQRVLLDAGLAGLYGVSTKRLNEQVRRNLDRFPEDFMFQLTAEEVTALRSQIATSKITASNRGGRRYLPYAFTEHGAIQAANTLNSPRAVEMGIYVVRAFVQLRELLASNKDLARRLDQLEARIEKKLTTHDDAIAAMLSAIRQLMHPPPPKRRGIGFTANIEEKS
jgi:ORF6N domain